MIEKNRHVNDFLEYYFNLEQSPEYAILIDGEWGAGKSWFIKKALNDLKENSGKYIYVSLYGIRNFSEIEDAFFEQMHPVLSSKGMKITAKILKSTLKATIKLDLDGNGDKETATNLSLDSLGLPNYLKNTSGYILVFDDIERCSINIGDLLGYINQFIEYHGYKVVLIANESEIKSDGDDGKYYLKTKEKLIGRTFKIEPDIDLALDAFIDVTPESLKSFYQYCRSEIVSIYHDSRCKNLRILKQALWDFSRIYNVLPESSFDKVDMVVEALKVFLCFSFESQSAKYKICQLTEIQESIFDDISNGEKSLFSILSSKYQTIDFSDLVIDGSVWRDFFEKGMMDQDSLKESIEKNKYYKVMAMDDWQRLWHFLSLTDIEFEDVRQTVLDNLDSKKYENYLIVKHLAGIYIYLSSIGLINRSKSDLLTYFKAYIDYLFQSNLLPYELKDRSYHDHDTGWDGLGYIGGDLDEFREFDHYLGGKYRNLKIVILLTWQMSY
ncbi:P-loop NTPase fold protein [Aeromonas piscicola]|uniref:P-loop NTPase fold protein n=1 Tax=Aeromonas piscicola TaxID=600645 RepID=UPI0006934ACB|nr:P-loop NTPase fold protein [Aeromonas piscicola]